MGKKLTLDHAVSCLKRGFVHQRQDEIRNLIAKTLDLYKEVAIEPPLAPLTGEVLGKSANVSDEARLDIAARGFWQKYEMAFFDVRVFNPFAKSYQKKQNLQTAFDNNEKGKKTYIQSTRNTSRAWIFYSISF